MALLAESWGVGGSVLEAQEFRVRRVRGRGAQRLMELHGEARGGGIGTLISGGLWRGAVEESREVVVVAGEPGLVAPLVDALWPSPRLSLCLRRLGHVAGGASDGEVEAMVVVEVAV
jgi:hypothetical protein